MNSVSTSMFDHSWLFHWQTRIAACGLNCWLFVLSVSHELLANMEPKYTQAGRRGVVMERKDGWSLA